MFPTQELPDGLVQCQHGPRECAGNLMMTCAKNVTEDDDVFLNFTRCVMDEMRGSDAGEMVGVWLSTLHMVINVAHITVGCVKRGKNE